MKDDNPDPQGSNSPVLGKLFSIWSGKGDREEAFHKV